ncbi:zinc carboxypeptidase [Niastella caeni]|uniref:Zinc carboxypeptidase n=1 Tax=Niastella caeni TaxID=2569763 RepID=A0A4S8HH04_9BACT|nr:M14 metallopeptidase family protein [Niastella caeni]THU32032.1 zinc carboxypeptidase [Niastella caeni]
MRRPDFNNRIWAIVPLFLFIFYTSKAQDLTYYLPDSVTYNSAIPKPKDIIYHEPGEWHVTHDRLVNYMQAIAAAAPNRVKLEHMGFTYESRPQVLLIITSPQNHQRLEAIREQHVQLSDPQRSGSLNIENMPLVVYIGHSIHGNEPSGANAALVSAYYLAAAQGKQMDELLENTVILFDPAFNPDGLQRFSTWVNQHKSKNLVTDADSREFNEVWPGGRFNHYWFDLNRDWLPLVHVESRNRLQWFHKWKPNILTDHHEQNSNATFFFQPGVPSRVNPLTPAANQELTGKLGAYHAAFLNRIGSLYFTKESYDDFYYGKGSTYPDINGAIGILFEQASSRGHAQQTENGILRFPFTIKNQFTATLSTLEGAKALRKEFLTYQRDFYKNAQAEAAATPVKGYVFGSARDKSKTALFVDLLRRQQIEVYELNSPIQADGFSFEKGNAFIVPAQQTQYKVIRTIFDKTFTYKDSLFYDITAWTLPLAFGLPYAELNAARFSASLMGTKVDKAPRPTGTVAGGKSNYAYLFEWDEFYAPRALYALQEAGVLTRTATKPFEIPVHDGNRKFNYGAIFIPVKLQTIDADKLHEIVKGIAAQNGITVYATNTGNVTSGSDLGSWRMRPVAQPTIAMLTGTGVNATDAGEIWFLLDQQFNIPTTHLDVPVFNRTDLNKYNTLIMVGGTYNGLDKEKLRNWIQAGGTFIVTEEAVQWAAQNGLTTVTFKKPKEDSAKQIAYIEREYRTGAQKMNGAIFRAVPDLSHPLAFGYNYTFVDLFKSNAVFPERNKNPYSNPLVYGDKPLQSGFVTKENYDAIKNSAAVLVNTLGNGRVISIADNPNFRAFWLGGAKLFMNAIFFGRLIEPGSGKND